MTQQEKIISAIGLFIRMNYPEFTKECVKIYTIGMDTVSFYDKERDFTYCVVDYNLKIILINGKVIDRLRSVFGSCIIYFIDWFNREFDQDVVELS